MKNLIISTKNLLFTGASKDAFSLFFLNITTQLTGLLGTIIVVRYLGPEDFGLLSITQTMVGFLFFLGGALDSYYSWQIASNSDSRNEVISRSISAKFFLNILIVIGSFILLPFLNLSEQGNIIFIVAVILSCLNSLFSIITVSMAIEKKIPAYVKSALATSFTLFFAKIIGVFFNVPVIYFVVIALIDVILTIFYLRIFYFNSFPKINISFSTFKIMICDIMAAKYYVGVAIASLVFTRIDQVFIKTLLNNHDLGLYAASVRLTEYPLILGGILMLVLMPRISSSNEHGFRTKALQIGFFLYLFIGIGCSIFFLLFGKYALWALYGVKFLPAAPILATYSYGLIGLWLTNFSNLVFAAYNKVHYAFIISIFGGAVSVISLYILIPIYGVQGAAYATVLAYITSGGLSILGSILVARHIFKTENLKRLLK